MSKKNDNNNNCDKFADKICLRRRFKTKNNMYEFYSHLKSIENLNLRNRLINIYNVLYVNL